MHSSRWYVYAQFIPGPEQIGHMHSICWHVHPNCWDVHAQFILARSELGMHTPDGLWKKLFPMELVHGLTKVENPWFKGWENNVPLVGQLHLSARV